MFIVQCISYFNYRLDFRRGNVIFASGARLNKLVKGFHGFLVILKIKLQEMRGIFLLVFSPSVGRSTLGWLNLEGDSVVGLDVFEFAKVLV